MRKLNLSRCIVENLLSNLVFIRRQKQISTKTFEQGVFDNRGRCPADFADFRRVTLQRKFAKSAGEISLLHHHLLYLLLSIL